MRPAVAEDLLIGYHAHRLKPEQSNPREVGFADQWKEENKYRDMLFRLLNREGRQNLDPDLETRRSVATVIQWLGSNVGMSFLASALERSPEAKKWMLHRLR